jgi:hypothetical protein
MPVPTETRIAAIIGSFKSSGDKSERMLGTILDEIFTATPEGQRWGIVKQVVDGLGKACKEFKGRIVVSGMLADRGRGFMDVGEASEGSSV